MRFKDGIAYLDSQGVTTYIELGPGAVLCAVGAESLDEAAFVPTLREGQPETQALITSLARAHTNGVEVDFQALFGKGAKAVELPSYAFQRQRHWLESSTGQGDATGLGLNAAGHPLLGAKLQLSGDRGLVLTGRLSLQTHPWLKDHTVMGTVFLPATAFLELAFCAAVEVGASTVEELIVQVPLVLPDRGAVQIQLSVEESDQEGQHAISIYSRPEQDDGLDGKSEWTCNASGLLGEGKIADASELAKESWPPKGAQRIELTDLYERLADAGIAYGPAFQGLGAAWRRGQELFGEVALDGDQEDQAHRFGAHPALFDAALHTALIGAGDSEQSQLKLPFIFTGVRLGKNGASTWRVRVTLEDNDAISLQATDERNITTVLVDSLATRALDPSQLEAGAKDQDSLLRVEWTEAHPSSEGDLVSKEIEARPSLCKRSSPCPMRCFAAYRQMRATPSFP